MLKEIPNIDKPDIFEKITPCNEKFVRLADGEFFDVKMQYPTLKMTNAVAECYVRKQVFEKLKTAQNLLPDGLKLRIWDAWRPFPLQEELYQKYAKEIIKKLNLHDEDEKVRQSIIAKYISLPVKDKMMAAVHTTGGAVDVTLINAEGKELDMGTGFDEFTPKTKTNYYETQEENQTIRDNRRILYNCMVSAGFTNLPSEWWHYDFGNKFWAYYCGTPILYTGVFSADNIEL